MYKASKRYFRNIYKNQLCHVTSIIDRLNLNGENVASIGSGVGAEEILFAQEGAQYIACIEPEVDACKIMDKYTHKFNVNNLQIYNMRKEEFTSAGKFSLIYASSPGDWMHGHTWREGIPDSYLQFIKKYMAEGGFFIVIIYGGTFHNQFGTHPHDRLTEDNQHEFVELLYRQCKENELYLLEYWKGWANAYACMIVLSNKYIRLSDDISFSHAFDRWHGFPGTRRVYMNDGN